MKWQLAAMALDVKSRAKRYEKLDFLGEGQVGRGMNPTILSLPPVHVPPQRVAARCVETMIAC